MRNYMNVAAAVIVLAACSGNKEVKTAEQPAGASMATVTGTVFYRERIALPPGATVTVQLVDMSIADAPATVLAKETITPTTQVPIPFTLSYDPKLILKTHTYAVQARIEVEGKLRFISTTANGVITNGRPSTAEILVSAVPQ